VYALNEALSVLSWYENLPDDEQPPRAIWWSDGLISEWFRNVKENRSNKSGSKRSAYEESEDVPMSENEMIDRSGPIPVIRDE
jgi:hypothetical protein